MTGRSINLHDGILGIGVVITQENFDRMQLTVERLRPRYPTLADTEIVDLIFCFGLDVCEAALSLSGATPRERIN